MGGDGSAMMASDDNKDPRAVFQRLTEAQNAHDLDAVMELFARDYRSEQPAHPKRAFSGAEQVRKNWSGLLTAVPDFRSELLRTAVDADTVWTEAHWTGTKADGSRLDEMVIGIFGVRDGRLAWGRLYSESVEREGEDIDERMQHLTGKSEQD